MFHSPSTRSSYSTHSPSLRYSQSRNSYGGYSGAPPLRTPAGPPAGADPQLWQWFTAVDVDRSGSISVTELQAALVNGTCTFGHKWHRLKLMFLSPM